MKAHLTAGNVRFELEAEKPKELFKLLAEAQETFGECECGLCKGRELRFVVRTVDGNDYHEIECLKCHAKLSLGQSKQKPGHLFPKRKLTREGKPDMENGSYGEHRGWTKYRGETPLPPPTPQENIKTAARRA